MKTRPGQATYNPPGTAGATAAKWDAGITSEAELQAVSTIALATTPPTIRAWVNAEDGTEQVWRLYALGTGLLPFDYSPTTNNKSWFRASS